MRFAILDLDGTIVDSMGYWRGFEKAFLVENGIKEENLMVKKRSVLQRYNYFGNNVGELEQSFLHTNHNISV